MRIFLLAALCLIPSVAVRGRTHLRSAGDEDKCAEGFPGSSSEERCSALVQHVEGMHSVLMNTTVVRLNLKVQASESKSKEHPRWPEIDDNFYGLEDCAEINK